MPPPPALPPLPRTGATVFLLMPVPPLPNNLGPTLLLALGLLTAPLLVGVPLLLLGLSLIRTVEGRPALPALASGQRRLWKVLGLPPAA